MIPITSVRVSLPPATDNPAHQRLLASVTIELAGCLVVRNCKLIRRDDGSAFVDLPSACDRERCPDCGALMPTRDLFCGRCGVMVRDRPDAQFRPLVFPTHSTLRKAIERAVIAAYHAELTGVNAAGEREEVARAC